LKKNETTNKNIALIRIIKYEEQSSFLLLMNERPPHQRPFCMLAHNNSLTLVCPEPKQTGRPIRFQPKKAEIKTGWSHPGYSYN